MRTMTMMMMIRMIFCEGAMTMREMNIEKVVAPLQFSFLQVGLHLTDSCVPAVKDNTLDSCFFR